MKAKQKAVVIYLTGNNEKDSLIKKYCLDNKLNVVGVFKPELDAGSDYLNSGIHDLFEGISVLSKKWEIDYVITYNLKKLDWSIFDLYVIFSKLINKGIKIFTIKEGMVFEDFDFNIKVRNLNKDSFRKLKKYWTTKDISNDIDNLFS